MSKVYLRKVIFITAGILTFGFLTNLSLFSLSQWSRKYGVSCTTCHTVFPRLTYFGEKFMRNGYQMPETQDGDEVGKKAIGNKLTIGEVGDFVGVRLNLSLAEIKTHSLKKNGEMVTSYDFGKPTWVQIFPGGAIFKNVSAFAEIEFTPNKMEVHWLKVGLHNIFGTSLLNIRFGQLAPTEWHAASGRLRMIPPAEAWRTIKSSGGKGEDSVDIGGGKPSLSIYGYKVPFLFEVGVQGGANVTDVNDFKNYWGVVRLEMPSGMLEGSSISLFAFKGVDTKDTATFQKRNNFTRISPAFNIRTGAFDAIFAYVNGKDDNWYLTPTNPTEVTHEGILAQCGYLHNNIYYHIRYDSTDYDDPKITDYRKITPSIWYLLRENLKIGFMARFDLTSPKTGKVNEYLIVLRSMF